MTPLAFADGGLFWLLAVVLVVVLIVVLLRRF
jgi:hypothetical protein